LSCAIQTGLLKIRVFNRIGSLLPIRGWLDSIAVHEIRLTTDRIRSQKIYEYYKVETERLLTFDSFAPILALQGGTQHLKQIAKDFVFHPRRAVEAPISPAARLHLGRGKWPPCPFLVWVTSLIQTLKTYKSAEIAWLLQRTYPPQHQARAAEAHPSCGFGVPFVKRAFAEVTAHHPECRPGYSAAVSTPNRHFYNAK
jgi:hypothetical protein